MFLVTTADERLWKPDAPLLFLGEWCKRFDRRSAWSAIPHDTLPYHWDDRTRLARDFRTVDAIYERTLVELAALLNDIHGLTHSTRYWRIILGPWLRLFIEILFDRHLSICTAAESRKATKTWIPSHDPFAWTPGDFPALLTWMADDPYNAYLYGRIIALTRAIEHETGAAIVPTQESSRAAARESWTRRFIAGYAHHFAGPRSRVVLVSSYLERRDQARLELALGQLPYVAPTAARSWSPPAIDEGVRAALTLGAGTTDFEALVAKVLPEQLPRSYLEGFTTLRDEALRILPPRPHAAFTADGYYANEPFKIWAAEHSARGANIGIAQHGGHNGTGLWSSMEAHELRVCDRYYTWGWMPDEHTVSARPLSSGVLISARRARAAESGGILWVTMTLPRYAYSMYSVPVGPQVLAYLRDQEALAACVSPEVLGLLLLRLYPHDFGWAQEARWREAQPSVRIYRGDEPLTKQLSRSRLLLGTYNATTFLQAFVANHPTVLFWNPAHWELRPAATPYYDALRDAEILHDTPQSAAVHLEHVYRNPRVWWNDARVQRARERFCQRYAHVRDDWLEEWKNALTELAAGSH